MVIRYNKNKKNNGVTLINYSNEHYTNAQKINTNTALKIGGFKKVISYSEKDIDSVFWNKNKKILQQIRGGGYWLWKPYIIKKALAEIDDGEYLFYCDSGSRFIEPFEKMIYSFDIKLDIIVFELQAIEKRYTKKDCLLLMDCDESNMAESKQRQATFSLWKKTDFSMKFLEEWLFFAKDERILTNIENELGFGNDENFVEHRHDQSIFSLMTKKYNLKAYRDPPQFGNNFKDLYPDSKYPQILVSTRQKNISFIEKIKKIIRPYLNPKLRTLYLKYLKNIFNLKLKF